MYNFLRRFRIVLALLVLVLITLTFVAIGGGINGGVAKISHGLLHAQFVPAMLGAVAGSFGILIVLVLLTLLFGRVYCSFLCPAGIFQDVVTTVANLFKSKKARRYTYVKPHHWLRYSILTITIAVFILGSSALLLWFDPYSNYGRMADNLFRPAVIATNNLGAEFFSDTFYHVSFRTFSIGSIVAATIFLVVITIMSTLRGRLYCNTICPVGSLLGLISNYSIFKIKINKTACTHCRMCEIACKSQCIDSKNESVDASRCVQCYNCTTACKFNAIGITFAYAKKEKEAATNAPLGDGEASRRRVFITSAGLLGAAAIAHAFTPKLRKKLMPAALSTKAIAPPGAYSIDNLKQHCTACHACVAKCPSQVIRPALGEYGLDGLLMPVLDYSLSFCNYECTECSNVCPNGALRPLSKEEKVVTQIGKAKFRAKNCIVILDETDCGACDEHCPTKAIKMVPTKNGLFIPKINKDLCIGCGGCEYICPGRPGKAIFVETNAEHQLAQRPTQDKQEEKEVTDFGF